MSLDKALSANPRDVAGALFYRLFQAELDRKVEKAYPDGGWDAYQQAIREAGNEPEQIATFERAGIILQPKQLEFAAWARRLDWVDSIEGEPGAPELGFGGAKGPGKSFVLFAQAAVDDCQRFDALKVLYLRKVGKKAYEQIADLMKAVLPRVDFEYKNGAIYFPNGSAILIGHFRHESEALNYAGLEYDLIIIEETTHLSEEAYKALRQSARTSKDWRPRIYNSTNPLGPGHRWYKKRFIDHERKHADIDNRSRKFIFATILDNKFVNEEYKGNLADLTPVQKRAYLDGDWDVSAGAYFEQWRHNIHVIDPIVPEPNWQVWASMDYGFNHWNVILLHAKDSDGVRYTFEEIPHRKHYPEQIVPDFLAKLNEYDLSLARIGEVIAGTDMWKKTGASKKSVAEQYEALGVKLKMAEMGPGSRVAGAVEMGKLLGNPAEDIPPRWYITSKCEMLIDTLPYLERDPNNPEDVLKMDANEAGENGDDAYDAARYGLYTGGVKKLTARTKSYIGGRT